MLTGGAERACTTFWRDQPRRTAFVNDLVFGVGISYVKPAETACLTSKSDGPLFAFWACVATKVLAPLKVEPAEAVSIECDHVYEASVWMPCDKRLWN